MSDHRFSIVDLAVSALLIIILVGVFQSLPGCGLNEARQTARKMQNSTHVRGIHSGMVLFAQGNRDFYPGLDPQGEEATGPLPDGPNKITTSATGGFDPAYRLAVMAQMGFFSGEYLVSPGEEKGVKTMLAPGGNLTSANYSYAMLRLNDAPAKGRFTEWRATNNSRAPVICDRNLGPAAGKSAKSIFNSPWQGSVVYNDNHANFETSNIIKTQFGWNYSANDQQTIDDLFADDKDAKGQPGNDAAMVHQDAVSYVNQK